MRLLINADCGYSNGWNGYDFMVGKDAATGRYSLMRNAAKGKYSWETVEEVSFRVEGNKMHVAVPRESLGHYGSEKDFDFKWADNTSDDNPDILSFISDGDVAPNGRFNYRYKGSELAGVGALTGVEADRAIKARVSVAGGSVTVGFTGTAVPVAVTAFDMLGRPVGSMQVAPGGEASMRLPKGVFVVRWQSEEIAGAQSVAVR